MTELLPVMPRYEAYKDSGVAWIGEIPEDWIVNRFKFLVSIKTGEKNTEDKETNGLYPFYVRSQIPETINSYSYDGEAILTAGDGAGVGKVYHYVNGKFDYHQRVYKFSDFKNVIGKYLYRYVSNSFFNVAILGTAKSTVDSLRLPLIQNFLICYPTDKNKQIAIANFLDCKTAKIDQAVAIKEKQIRLLKERKQILIQNAVTKGLDPNVPMADSGVEWIGQIPAHWKVKRLRFIGKTQNGISAGADYFGSGYPFVSYSDVYNNRELPRSVKGLAKSSINDQIHYSVEQGDVLFTRTSETIEEIGFSSACMETIPNSTFAGFLIRFRPKPEILEPGYSKYYFCANMHRAYFVGKMNIVIRASLSQELLKNLPVLLPPKKEQKSIYTHIQTQSTKIDRTIAIQEQMIEKLKEYKATLINAAVTGKIKVPDPAENKVVA
ncbi:restriction endonuclease subunit S [Desulfobacter curvatus]|uniref:restriction endonuclease subunit S n=1 Tax=Desulfobacter curvatus TaxID=2290 RepID=UPI00038140F9|nr:restriction endonuclease subunit S [Desulfobacter curvatus]